MTGQKEGAQTPAEPTTEGAAADAGQPQSGVGRQPGSEREPGAALRAARETMGVSCREVAQALNLPLRSIEAMEANEFDRLPSVVFARGYIRSYAKLLDLDGAALMAGCPKVNADEPIKGQRRSSGGKDWVRHHPQLVLAAMGGLVALVIIVLALLLWPADDAAAPLMGTGSVSGSGSGSESGFSDVPRSGPGFGPSNATVQQGAAAEVAEAAGQAVPSQDVVALAAPVEASSPPTVVADEVADEVASGRANGQVAATGVQSSGPQRITPTGDARLTFDVTEDCWVEVKSTDGRSLYSDLGRAGQVLELVGTGPFRVLLGYAPGVRMSFNGEPVALAPHTRNNIATLVLGQ